MEFFHLIKATQKSGKEDAVIWFTAKSEARANLQLDVELEDAGIETGRGKDYSKPVRTDFPVYDDLPEESTVDYSWCKRYELQDDGRTWLPKAAAESTGAVDNIAAPEPIVKVETTFESVPLENRTPAVRFAVHLTSDKYQSHITKEQQLAASEMSLDEGNTYLQNLLLAKNDIPEVAELCLNAEWKLVQAIKQVFAPDEAHKTENIAAFMADWAKADASDRNQLVEDWCSGKFTPLKSESTSDIGVIAVEDLEPDNGIQIDENDDETTRYPVVRMPFRKQLLAQFTADELRYHITREEYEGISALEMDTDNSYVQNLLLAAENCEEVKGYDTKDLWRYTDAIRKVFEQEKRHELALVLQFTIIWAETDYIDRGLLVKEWSNGNRVSCIQRTESGANAGGGNQTDRNPDLKHDLDTLDLEIALATLPMDFNIYDIPGGVFRRAKEVVSKKESPFKEWSKALRATPGVLDYSRAAIFALIRSAHPEYYLYPARLSGYINANLTESNHSAPSEETLVAARHNPGVSWTNEVVTDSAVETDGPEASGKNEKAQIDGDTQPVLEKVGNGLFSIEGLTTSNTTADHANTAAEYVDNVQLEIIGNDEIPNSSALSEGPEESLSCTSATETYSSTAAINNDSGHHNHADTELRYTHLMVDIESLGKKADSPIVSIGAVFFDPSTGNTGSEFYKVISLESSMASGGVPDASTIIFWLKASPEARSELVMDDAIPLDDALLQLNEFIAENAANGPDSVQVWGNGATYDNVLLEASYDRTGIPCPWKFWNNRDVRTIVELGKAVGCKPRYEIPFEGEPHKAISDALHQVKYVSVIWQRLTEH
ncbi:exonuclease [Scandinavium lactucae]|uniref:3'-5' exoribonuclease n=1 Tax=Scandinavium lactucae TaxID=3095028 RepID=A0ABU4QWD4_9ENTR|nr:MULTISPECIES: 3'-5' exoribonuclease [unclassified Scandinavium]MDX6042639.1 3'-5' exoribonuclease [Scandinavium sp. V105_6]MDX6052640.1 3'-5' exoribonuclease [Scandinavium sp. V105_1]